MLKRNITYEDFDGNSVTETFYFNISKPELVELEVEKKGGFSDWIQAIIKAEDNKTVVEQFKRIVLLAYGVKSEDGKRFIKNDQLREEFSQTNAYNELFMELATQEDAAVRFLTGVLPKDMAEEIQKSSDPKALATTPPAVPTE